MFCHEAFFRTYLPLALDVYNRLFIESLGVLVVNEIRKHLLGSPNQNTHLVHQSSPHPPYLLLHSSLQLFLIIEIPSGLL